METGEIPGSALLDQTDSCNDEDPEQESLLNTGKEVVHLNLEEPEQPPLCCDRDPEHDNTTARDNIEKWFRHIVLAAVAVFIAVALFFVLLDAFFEWHSQSLTGPACPYDWIGYRGRCYFFSSEKRNWTFSQNFCSLQKADLLIFNPSQEKEFVMRLKGKAPFWIGLSRDSEQHWKWTNGDISKLTILGDGGNCAFLNSEANAVSSRCHTELPWICSKVDIFNSQNTR